MSPLEAYARLDSLVGLQPWPTIEELEAILNAGEEVPIEILPNGELRTR